MNPGHFELIGALDHIGGIYVDYSWRGPLYQSKGASEVQRADIFFFFLIVFFFIPVTDFSVSITV